MPVSRATPGENRTYFPFFSDFRCHNATALRIGESCALAFVFLLSLAGNIWGISLLVRRPRRLRAANCLVLNLFCADLLFITAMPFIAVVRWTESWLLGNVVCHLLLYVVSLSGAVIILSLSAVSLERVVSIARLRHAAFRRRKVLAAALLFIWGFAALATLPLCCFFTVVRLPDPSGQVRAGGSRDRRRRRLVRPCPGGTAGSGQRGDASAGWAELCQPGRCEAVPEERPELPPLSPGRSPADRPVGCWMGTRIAWDSPLCAQRCPFGSLPLQHPGRAALHPQPPLYKAAQIPLPDILKCIQKYTQRHT